MIGIDPGESGGIALLIRGGVWTVPLPISRRSNTSRLDVTAFCGLVNDFRLLGAPPFVLIEHVGGLPRQSAPRAYNFGFACGQIDAACVLLGLAVRYVRPQVWRARTGVTAAILPTDRDSKAASVRVADATFPAHAWQWHPPRPAGARRDPAPLDGLAEAALIAFYGSRECT
jgi:hypothetical protein